MRLFLLTALTMTAFAANSLLNRMALVGGGMDAVSFGTLRLVAGAVMLAVLCMALRGGLRLGHAGQSMGVAALLLYIYGFSAAYDALDAGLGALILFGMVQVTMFMGALAAREVLPPRRWIGAGVSFAGLVWLLWPGAGAQTVSLWHGASMAAAGVGWGIYSLMGRGASDGLSVTAANFALAAPLGVLLWLVAPGDTIWDGQGVVLAVLSGAVASGLGYALWYALLPRLQASVAAVAQLSVPVIAIAGGMVLLAEAPSLRIVLAGALVLGGVALSVGGRVRVTRS